VHNAWDTSCTAIDVDCKYTIHILYFDYSSIRVQELDIFIHILPPCGCAEGSTHGSNIEATGSGVDNSGMTNVLTANPPT
jgi:hypothetical protein